MFGRPQQSLQAAGPDAQGVGRRMCCQICFMWVVDPTAGVKEIFDHLKGWRKKDFKAFVLSGSFVAQQFGSGKKHVVQWSYGRLDPKATRAECVVQKYDAQATDWTDCREVTEHLTWRQICAMCAI